MDAKTTFTRIQQDLGPGQKQADRSINVHCPAHEDKTPSCNIKLQENQLLVHCYAGCSQEAVISSLRERGLWPGNNGNEPQSRRPAGIPAKWYGAAYVTHWTYRDRDREGRIVGHVARYEGPNGKAVIPFFAQNNTNAWKAGAAPQPRPLYGLDRLAAYPSKPVMIVEGEKTTDAARQLVGNDYVCVTWPGGTNAVHKADWTPLRGRDVVIWPDADEPGEKAALTLQKCLEKAGAKSTRIVPPPEGVRKGWDLADGMHWPKSQIADYIEKNAQNKDQIKKLIELAKKGQRGAAQLFADKNINKLCYDHTQDAWFIYKKHYWIVDKIGDRLQQAVDQVQADFQKAERNLDGEIIVLAQKIKKAEGEQAEKIKQKLDYTRQQQKSVTKLINNLNNLAYRKQVVEFAAQGKGSLGITGDEWDLKPWLVACPNGILDLTTGDLRDGKPEDYLRAACPTNYNPQATAPRWEQALQEIFAGDQELIAFVQRVLGMSLVGEAVEHKLIVLWGAGRNGKDTMLEALAFVLGPALAGAVQSELLLDQGRVKSSSGPSADVMRLRGLRLSWASETNEGRRLDAGKIKLLTGGGNLVGRSPYARYEVSFPQSHTLFLLTNSKPHAPSDDYALWKRLVLIPFTQSFVDDPQYSHEHLADKSLPDKLKNEAEGILAWLVRGCLDWQAQGLNPPSLVQQATQEYQKEEDILLQFVEDACVQGPQHTAQAQQLYNHYREWMQKNGLKPMSGAKFGRKMAERFAKEKKAGGLHYMDLGILDD